MIYSFDTYSIPHVSEVGGKAKTLIETTKAGFSVPKGIVLSVSFFEKWLMEIKTSSEWKALLTDTTKENCDIVKEKASRINFSSGQKQLFENEINELQGDLFAVRSSSPDEDLEEISFAGMYETYLGITKDDLEHYIVNAFSSCFDYRVMAYKRQNNINIENTSIAIIVQKQIASDLSGVGFSLNPHNNAYDEVVINASFGLGESIVSGMVTPDTYVVDAVKRTIIEKKVSDKKIGLWLKQDGGIIEKKNEKSKQQALTEVQILELSSLIKSCESHFGKPMDIEWAISEGELYLLQVRPITTYFQVFKELVTVPGKEKHIYLDLIILTQGFSSSLSVLGLDIWKQLLNIALGFPEGEGGILVNVHGRQYLDISNMAKALGIKSTMATMGNYDVPTKKIMEYVDLKTEYMPSVKTKKMKKALRGSMKNVFEAIPIIMKSVISQERVLESYKEKSEDIFDYCKIHLSEEKNFELIVKDGMSAYEEMVKYSYAIILAVLTTPKKINKLFRNEEVDDLIIALGMDLPGNPTGEMGRFMLKLASYEEIQNTITKEEFIDKFMEMEYSEKFYADYNNYLERFGARCFKEIDIATPRSYEQPEELFMQLKQININDNAIMDVKKRREEAYDKLLDIAKNGGCEKKFVKYAKTYHDIMGYRELPKYIYIVITDMLRKRALVLGERFKKEDRLEDINQIFDLSISQISDAEKNDDLKLFQLIEKNSSYYKEAECIKSWPSIIDSRGKIFRYVRESENGELVGDPIAPGIVRGKAKVLIEPYEKPLIKGEILVTRSTEPSWTPIFINAAGVVLEVGGPLQHGAIIAREYGIPCVSGISNAVEIIKDGDLIEIDGSSGRVKIINREMKNKKKQ